MWNKPEIRPDSYLPVLLLIEISFETPGFTSIQYQVQGYFHEDGVYCDYSGLTIDDDEEVLAWTDLNLLPDFVEVK